MKGKWAKGIAPRFFAWIIKDKLAVSERPGGYARNHRRVRRQEEILWLRGEGFTRVVSLLTSPHNLHAYDELDMAWAHIPFGAHDDPHVVLPELYAQLREWMASGERLLVHHEELSDRLMGVVAGYLRWSGLVPEGPQAISVVERIMHRQMGPDGRELVALAPQLAGAGGSGVVVATRGRTSEDTPPRVRAAAPTAAAEDPTVEAERWLVATTATDSPIEEPHDADVAPGAAAELSPPAETSPRAAESPTVELSPPAETSPRAAESPTVDAPPPTEAPPPAAAPPLETERDVETERDGEAVRDPEADDYPEADLSAGIELPAEASPVDVVSPAAPEPEDPPIPNGTAVDAEAPPVEVGPAPDGYGEHEPG